MLYSITLQGYDYQKADMREEMICVAKNYNDAKIDFVETLSKFQKHRLFEAFGESAPQASLQVNILLRTGIFATENGIRIISTIISMLSLSTAATDMYLTMPTRGKDYKESTWKVQWLLVFPKMALIVLSRIITLGLLMTYAKYFLFVFISLHICFGLIVNAKYFKRDPKSVLLGTITNIFAPCIVVDEGSQFYSRSNNASIFMYIIGLFLLVLSTSPHFFKSHPTLIALSLCLAVLLLANTTINGNIFDPVYLATRRNICCLFNCICCIKTRDAWSPDQQTLGAEISRFLRIRNPQLSDFEISNDAIKKLTDKDLIFWTIKFDYLKLMSIVLIKLKYPLSLNMLQTVVISGSPKMINLVLRTFNKTATEDIEPGQFMIDLITYNKLKKLAEELKITNNESIRKTMDSLLINFLGYSDEIRFSSTNQLLQNKVFKLQQTCYGNPFEALEACCKLDLFEEAKSWIVSSFVLQNQAFEWACLHMKQKIINFLLNIKGKCNIKIDNIVELIDFAQICKDGNNRFLEILLKNHKLLKYDATELTYKGDTGFQIACKNDYYKCVALYLQYEKDLGMNLNSLDDNGQTGFHNACENGCFNSVKVIVVHEMGSDKGTLNVRNAQNELPLDIAIRNGCFETISLIRLYYDVILKRQKSLLERRNFDFVNSMLNGTFSTLDELSHLKGESYFFVIEQEKVNHEDKNTLLNGILDYFSGFSPRKSLNSSLIMSQEQSLYYIGVEMPNGNVICFIPESFDTKKYCFESSNIKNNVRSLPENKRNDCEDLLQNGLFSTIDALSCLKGKSNFFVIEQENTYLADNETLLNGPLDYFSGFSPFRSLNSSLFMVNDKNMNCVSTEMPNGNIICFTFQLFDAKNALVKPNKTK